MRRPALNLTAALAVTAAVELVLFRLMARVFLPQAPAGGLPRAMAVAGRFAHDLGGVLGLVVVLATLAVARQRRALFPRSMRLTAVTIALFFVAIAALGVVVPLPERLLVHLKTSHAFLSLFVAMAVWASPAALGPRLAVTLFAAPAVLQAIALFADRLEWEWLFPGELTRAAEIGILGAAALSAVLAPVARPRGARLVAGLVAAAVAAAGLAVSVAMNFDLVQTVALYGFRLDVPALSRPGGPLYLALVFAAVAGTTAAAVFTLTVAGGSRLVGLGLLLLAASGSLPLAPPHVLFAACGLLAIAVGASRTGTQPQAPPA